MREDQMRAALERRRPDQSHRFNAASLGAAIDMGLATKGGRWLTEILNTHAPHPFGVSRDRLQAGLASVSDRGWVTLKDDDVSLNSPLVEICLELGSSTPFLVVGIGSGSLPAAFVMAVRGISGFWTFRFGVPTADKVRFSRLGGKMLEGLVYHHLAGVLRARQATAELSPQSPEASVCVSCNSPLRPQARFCTRCGTPTPPPSSGG
jgi:ribosomal protein L40E